jgi:hypothetical protein
MLSQGTLGLTDTIFSGNPGWLRGANIVITSATEAAFNSWYLANEQISVGGESLSQWAQWTAGHDQLPPEVCGPSASASALQKRVFGHDTAAGNPWGTLV